MFRVCPAILSSIYCSLVVTYLERADLLPLLYVVIYSRHDIPVDIVIPKFQNPAGPSRGTVIGESSRCQWSATRVCSRSSTIFDLYK